MSTRPAVPAVKLTVAYLSSVSDVTDLFGTTIGTKLPREWSTGDRALRVNRVGGLPVRPDVAHLRRARLQLDVFGSSDADAEDSMRVVLAVMQDLPSSGFEYPGAVVTAVRQDLGEASVPDPETDAPRWLAGIVLYSHSAPS